MTHWSPFPPARKWSQALSWYWNVLFALKFVDNIHEYHITSNPVSITSWNTFTWANKTFQYQERAWDHFLAGGKRLKCLIFAHLKVFQLVIDTGWDIIYVIWCSWMFSTHFKANNTLSVSWTYSWMLSINFEKKKTSSWKIYKLRK